MSPQDAVHSPWWSKWAQLPPSFQVQKMENCLNGKISLTSYSVKTVVALCAHTRAHTHAPTQKDLVSFTCVCGSPECFPGSLALLDMWRFQSPLEYHEEENSPLLSSYQTD